MYARVRLEPSLLRSTVSGLDDDNELQFEERKIETDRGKDNWQLSPICLLGPEAVPPVHTSANIPLL